MRISELLDDLETLENQLDSIKYELEASVYTVEDDEFAKAFFVRDQLYLLRKRIMNELL